MAEPEVLAVPSARAEPEAAPHVSLIVPIYNEQASVDELYRRTIETLEAADLSFEVIFVDDGSTDATFDRLSRLHESDPRLRVVSFDRNYGQHPAMHAGISRARGRIVVTMDGDLQNAPSDIPKLVAAVEAGADVASGRRLGRDDPALRRLPSAAINRMLARLTGVDLADFGCAFNAYRREALDPVMHRIGRQKFTKAIVCSTGVRVVEVDLQHRAREGKSRYRPLALVKMGLQVVTGFWPGLSQRVGLSVAVVGILSGAGVGVWGLVDWIQHGDPPGLVLLGALVLLLLGLHGALMAIVGEQLGRIERLAQRGPGYTIEREI
jgi:undecaprenyl-phosphate 4-deoxy-4-formamido-L-arabinose transferase